MKREHIVAILLILVLIASFGLVSTLSPLGLWPGVEGLDAGVVGYQTKAPSEYAGYYGTNERFPSYDENPQYEWDQWPTVDPYNTLISKSWKTWFALSTHTLLVERQTPTRDESLTGRKIEYWVPYGNNSRMKVVGTVVPWTFTVQIAIRPGSGVYEWPKFEGGEAVWFGLGTKKWDRAYPDPDNRSILSNAGWSIPLAVYIEKYDPYGFWTEDDKQRTQKPKTEWVTECVQITPDLDGRTITLFSDPETPVTLDDVWYHGGLSSSAISNTLEALNSTVAFDPRPDTRFASHTYFKFTFTMFKPKQERDWLNQVTAVWYPSVIYRLRVYYLELGQFIYVQEEEDLPPWDPRAWGKIFTPYKDWWDSFFGALGILNPFGVFGPWAPFVAFLFTLFIIGIIIFVLILIFFPSLLARGAHGIGQARQAYETGKKS